MQQLEFNFPYRFSNDLERRLFKQWVAGMYEENKTERRKYGERPYKTLYSYAKKNWKFLIYEWESSIRDLSFSNAEIS